MTQDTTVRRVRFEHLTETLGIGVARPRLSWTVETERPNWIQAAYEVEAYAADGRLRGGTGRVETSDSVLVRWPFAPLASREQVEVRVRVWGTDGSASDWSERFAVEAGLLEPADWQARFIRPGWEEAPGAARPGPLLRKEFTARGEVKQARLYVTALGVYDLQINGSPVCNHVLDPGWTSYRHRLRYHTFDVTGLIAGGRNAIGAMLGDGWFRGRIGYGGGCSNIYGEHIALLAQLELEYADGTRDTIVTDESWKAARGPIVFNSLYDGETYDARLEHRGWSDPGFDDWDWSGVQVEPWDLATLFAANSLAVRRHERIEPVAVTRSPSGRTILDFGQNLVGRVRIQVEGPAGQAVTFRHAEVLENGELATGLLREAKATDTYILKGQGLENWEPRFTFHGFRYVEVYAWPGELRKDSVTAVVCHSALERTGWFECSDPLLNRLHENVVWSMRGNFLDIPTDCPQRDERLGWTGDIQVFSPTASFLYDCAGFLASWLRDLAVEQAELGVVPFVVPNVLPDAPPPAAAWGDAAVVVPWVLYQRFGDVQILEDQFESMRAWVDLIERIAGPGRLWEAGFQFGDWLDPSAPPEKPGKARTPSDLIATAYFARSAELVGLAAGVLSRRADEERYLSLARDVRSAFNAEFVTPSGRLLADTSTAYALALQFALLPGERQRRHAAQRLAAQLRANGYHIDTGFVGTPLVCDALCSQGLEEAAFRLLIQHECPSWLYPVTMGATTIWERWDSLLPDGSLNPGKMISFNHYALGAVADWMHRTIGGIAPAAPGCRRLEVKPRPGGGLTSAKTAHLTPYGLAICAWKIGGGQISVEVQVPPNTTATVVLPGMPEAEPIEVGSGRHRWSYAYVDAHTGQRTPLSVESTVGEFLNDERARRLLVSVIHKHGTELADQILAMENRTLRQALVFMPQGQEILKEIIDSLETMRD
jgi:alpha-L-rhamnosidase